MNSEEMLLCHYCGQIFYKLSSLESHTRWKHSEKSNDFMCDQCGKTFHKKFNLIKHLACGVHKISESVKCALCEFRTLTRKVMCGHYTNFHNIVLNERNAYFQTSEEFFTWKIQYENRTRARFVKMSSSRRRKNGFLRSTYFCHRDGNFIPKGKNLRHLKMKGSNKINAHCPAKIEVEVGENTIIVSYIDTHLGHDLDISRMNLDASERAIIAEKLALKVPFEHILNEINSKNDTNDMRRINLLTRKDLWNIVETFKINPKNVIYNKTRMRRKNKLNQPKIESTKNKVYLKIYNGSSSKLTNQNHVTCSVLKEKKIGNEEVIETNDENEYSNLLYPIILQDENNEAVEKYVIISDEHISTDADCLVINSMGQVDNDEMSVSQESEIQSIDNEGLPVCQEAEIQSLDNDVISVFQEHEMPVFRAEEIQSFDNDEMTVCQAGDIQLFGNDEMTVCQEEDIQSLDNDELAISEGDVLVNSNDDFCQNDINRCDQSAESIDINSCKADEVTIYDGNEVEICEDNKIRTLQNKANDSIKQSPYKIIKVILGNQEYQVLCNDVEINEDEISIVNEVNEAVDKEPSLVTVEDITMDHLPGCEVTIDNLEEKDCLVVSDCKEDLDVCNLLPSNSATYQNLYSDITPDKLDDSLVEAQINGDISNNIIIKLEAPDCCVLDGEEFLEECKVITLEEHQWDNKRDVFKKW